MATDNNHPLTSFSWPFLITFGNNGEIERERERDVGADRKGDREADIGRDNWRTREREGG